MGILSAFSGPSTSTELHKLSNEYKLPKRLLSEAQNVLMYRGCTPHQAKKHLKEVCESTARQGTSVEAFAEILNNLLNTFPQQ